MLSLLSKKAQESLKESEVSIYKLLNDYEKIDCLTKRDIEKIQVIKESFNNYNIEKISNMQVTSSSDFGNTLVNMFNGLKHEEVWIFCLDTKNNVIHFEKVFKGSLNSSIMHPREIFKIAIKHSTARLILMHNHPSGNTEPSTADLKSTDRMVKAGEVLGIEVLDHFIIGDTYLSLRETGLM